MRHLSLLALASIVVPAIALGAVTGCSDGTTTTEKSGSPAASSTSSATPAPGDKPAAEGDGKDDSSLGPSCKAYLECCDEVAAKVPQLGASCDSTRKSITDAQGKGASVESYESACKSGLDGFKSASYCK
jgi:hypothetical protein